MLPLKRSLLPLLLTALTGCANDWSFSSNLDKENFVDYYKHTSVKVVTEQQAEEIGYQLVGSVEGESCQESNDLPPPDIAAARTDARRKAADLDANGVIIDICTSIQPEGDTVCVNTIVCFGRAVLLATTE